MEYVITGKLNAMSREQAAKAIELHGDSFGTRVTHRTFVLVQGQLWHWPSNKLRVAMKYATEDGQRINVITEEQFLEIYRNAN